jgi:hypothetical protein
MSALTATAQPTTATARHSRRFMPLVRADFLKLRKSRGLVWTSALMTIGVVIVMYAVLAVVHSSNPAKHGPAGGIDNLGHGVFLLAMVGSVAAVLIGAAAGAGDLVSGVFRELVVTGRSRLALFASRLPGGLAVIIPIVTAAFAVMAAASIGLTDSLPAPSYMLIVEIGAWLALEVGFYFALALGLGSLLGSRAQTIGILLAWRLAVLPIVSGIAALGIGRDAFPGATIDRLAPGQMHSALGAGATIATSVTAAVLAMLAWMLGVLALGAWRTATRDA